jgi:folate-binding protein YgfZ
LKDAALVDPGAWEVISARGNDRMGFLHRVLTGKMEGTAAGQGGRTMLLTTKGQVVSDMSFFVRPDEVRLLVAPGEGASTVAALSRYAIMDDFAAHTVPELQLLAVQGARAEERLRAAGVTLPDGFLGGPLFSHADGSAAEGALWLVRMRAHGSDGVWLFGAAATLAAVRGRLEQAGVRRLGADAAEVLRILAGEPKVGAEITSDYFPMEVGRTDAIDYGKGCFLGQEPIVRIRDRGHINWRLVGLRFADQTPVAAGDRLETDLKPKAGRLTSVAQLPDGRPVALGLLHVSVPAGAQARVRHGDSLALATVVGLAEET